VVDAQSGHEKTITSMLPALAGANVIYGLGMLEMGITFDLAQLVLDHEIAGMVLHSLDGIVVNDETLSVDVIRELGIGKDYMSHESTYKHMKSQSQAQIIDRRMREDWEAAGSTDAYKRAHERVIEILETYEPAPLPANVLNTIRSIVEEAEKELVR
jgi:trimethylamine--corrinoid protein Co-methyltransferase